MAVSRGQLVDQELVVHLFAPIEGPLAALAYEQTRQIWKRCQHRLGMTGSIPNTGLPTELPEDPRRLPSNRALAAQEDLAADYQAIVRREHDVLNLSMVFAAPLDTPSRRLRIGSASPPGWIEFDRWWDELAAAGTDALLGEVRLYQAQFTVKVAPPLGQLGQVVRAVLPAASQDPYWWDRGQVSNAGFATWEVSPSDARGARRIVVIAPEDHDRQLSAWTWSRGDVALPPLARYLMHAAKLRYQARVRGNGQQMDQLRQRVNDHVMQVKSMLETSWGHPDELTAFRDLRVGEAELVMTATDLRDMQRTVRIALDNMTATHDKPFRSDQDLAEWLTRQLEDDTEYLDAARQRAQEIGRLFEARAAAVVPPPTTSVPAQPTKLRSPSPSAPSEAPARIELRMGFAVDVVGYSTRSSPDKASIQARLADLVQEVLGELQLRLKDTDHQGTGDGMNVFLPATVELHIALPRLLRAWEERLAVGNRRFQDRLRLRLAMVVGPVGLAAIGFTGSTIVEVNRLLNSSTLRRALQDNPSANLAVLVSDQLYQHVVGEGYPGVDPTRFERHLIVMKEFRRHAWLWVGG
jgi:hypothetical protein